MKLKFCSYLFDPKIYEGKGSKEREMDDKKRNRIKHKVNTVHYGLIQEDCKDNGNVNFSTDRWAKDFKPDKDHDRNLEGIN